MWRQGVEVRRPWGAAGAERTEDKPTTAWSPGNSLRPSLTPSARYGVKSWGTTDNWVSLNGRSSPATRTQDSLQHSGSGSVVRRSVSAAKPSWRRASTAKVSPQASERRRGWPESSG